MDTIRYTFGRRDWLLAASALALAPAAWAAPAASPGPKVQLSQYVTEPGADDTDAFVAALTAAVGGTLVVPAIELTLRPVTVPSNVRIELAPGTVLKAKSGFGPNDRLLNITNATNVTIMGNGATVQMPKAEYKEGEQRHGVFIFGSSDVQIHDLVSRDSGGDGFYIGRSGKPGTHSRRVLLNNCRAINNRRQGLSIVSGEDIEVRGGIFESTAGTAPQYGIDIEPNNSDDVIRNVRLLGVRTRNNRGGGLLIVLQSYANRADVSASVEVVDFTSEQDGLQGASAGIRLAGFGGTWGKSVSGQVKIRNARIVNPGHSGIRLDRWDADRAPLVQIDDVEIVNPGSASAGAQAPEERSGLVIWASHLGGANFGNLQASRVRVRDTRGQQLTYSPVYIYGTPGQSGVGHATRITLRDCVGVGLKPTSGRGHLVAATDLDESSVEYSTEQVASDVPADDVVATRSLAGYTITQASGAAIRLPPQATNRGLTWSFRPAGSGAQLRLRPDPSDRLNVPVDATGDLVVRPSKQGLRVRMDPQAGLVSTQER
ncbi:right-handed parallel beta-helix repeat-containing protein [Methylibium rhizosphaerae]|uniref:right-handed parallel beta-helix repeat-containing protein n=1 Tax=Methylibium rhizosphaerae TaxID=2570323 RepID=UPI0015E33223|nr:right-handed parallel beta-helix repeat-containing protein [Methylibium rhizosphaerae]